MKYKILRLTVLLLLIIGFILTADVNKSYGGYSDYEINNLTEANDAVDSIDDSVFSTFSWIPAESMIKLIDADKIKGISINGDKVYAVTVDSERYYSYDVKDLKSYIKLNGLSLASVTLIDMEEDDVEPTRSFWSSLLITGLRLTIIMIIVGIVLYFLKAVACKFQFYPNPPNSTTKQALTSAKQNSDDDIPTVKFSDVEGIDELKIDIARIVDSLTNPNKYRDMGARLPNGVILYGPPGTGKTLLAKAIAGEANVPFIPAVGSDFIEKYVGVGAKRVRELYSNAKKKAPCIVFIDEIDAVASQRGNDENSERDQTINALLAELDGFNSKDRVVTICATNRLDLLDSAFTRAGRFDLKLAVGLPDKKSRIKILQMHGKNKKLADNVSFDELASKTVGFSGAELEALLNEAAMLAAGNNQKFITRDNIDDAFFKIVMKGNKKKREEITKTNRIIAWHESGHTLATKLMTEDDVSSVTIVGSYSGAGGVTFRNPKDEELYSRKYLKNLVGVMYAGRAAEEIFLGDKDLITTGASQDIKQATGIIKQYIAVNGMGELGLLDLSQLRSDYGNIVNEASKLSKEIYTEVYNLLLKNKDTLEKLAESLIEKETLSSEEINEIIDSMKVVGWHTQEI